MRVKMNTDYTAALDGIRISTFPAGAEADIPERIAAVLLKDGRASLPDGVKALNGAPENKMLGGSPQNKGSNRGGRRK